MGFLAEMLAAAVVWLSSFALCQFGVAIEPRRAENASSPAPRTVARSPRGEATKLPPIAANAAPDVRAARPREA